MTIQLLENSKDIPSYKELSPYKANILKETEKTIYKLYESVNYLNELYDKAIDIDLDIDEYISDAYPFADSPLEELSKDIFEWFNQVENKVEGYEEHYNEMRKHYYD